MELCCVDRELIINALEKVLKHNQNVYALWLEGADGLGVVDEYSDLDFVVDVEDGYEDRVFSIVEEALKVLGNLDVNHRIKHGHPKMRQKVYHVEDSSEYLLIDFCIQSHSRDRTEGIFVRGDIVEAPKLIFDKDNVVRFGEEPELNKEELKDRIYELQGRYKQHSRVLKYIERNNYPEAYIYYMKYVADPLTELMRIRYTPKYYYMYMIHISNHIPRKEVEELEQYYKIKDFDDIRLKVRDSSKLFNRLIKEIEKNIL